MVGFFVLILVIWAIHYWYAVPGVIALWAAGYWLLGRWRSYWTRQRHEAADRLRHEQARHEIRRITAATTKAMLDAARER
ncbi:MAG TPA: hypothetical protein VGF95_04105 [Solirubrobacteraceae bacterium]|jgi:hypothetical protein